MKNDTPLLNYITRLFPLFWVLIINLLVTIINTYCYCFLENDSKCRSSKKLLVLAVVNTLIGISIGGFASEFISDFIVLIKNHEASFSGISSLFHDFSIKVSIITYVTFGFFLSIDFTDILSSREELTKERKNLDCLKKRLKLFDSVGDDRLKGERELLVQKEMDSKKRMKVLDLDKEYSLLQLLLIDLTVLICSVSISWYSSSIDSTITDSHINSDVFLTGAWGFQILYSQFVFYILTMRNYYENQKIDENMIDEREAKDGTVL